MERSSPGVFDQKSIASANLLFFAEDVKIRHCFQLSFNYLKLYFTDCH